jgi:hypothetical protein
VCRKGNCFSTRRHLRNMAAPAVVRRLWVHRRTVIVVMCVLLVYYSWTSDVKPEGNVYVPPKILPPYPGEKSFDHVFYINLDHRTDRKRMIEAELGSVHWLNKTTRIPAVPWPALGALGCIRSHISAMKAFLADPSLRHALFMEDDITFLYDPRVNVTRFLKEHGDSGWDVLMLASNTNEEAPYREYATRILDAQTASAYAVTREFAPKLLELFEEGERGLAVAYADELVTDQIWKRIQRGSRWYCLKPRVGIQRPSYSDIEKKAVDYGV